MCANLFADKFALNVTLELVDFSTAVFPDDSEERVGIVTALVPVACAELSLAIAARPSGLCEYELQERAIVAYDAQWNDFNSSK